MKPDAKYNKYILKEIIGIFFIEDGGHLKDEDGYKAKQIKDKATYQVMNFNFGRICLQFSIFVKAGIEVDDDVHQEDGHDWEVDKLQKVLVFLFVSPSSPIYSI